MKCLAEGCDSTAHYSVTELGDDDQPKVLPDGELKKPIPMCGVHALALADADAKRRRPRWMLQSLLGLALS